MLMIDFVRNLKIGDKVRTYWTDESGQKSINEITKVIVISETAVGFANCTEVSFKDYWSDEARFPGAGRFETCGHTCWVLPADSKAKPWR
jgi:hypothetical protein